MTPQEKAKNLIKEMYDSHPDVFSSEAIECSMVAVNEILNNKSIMLIGSRKYWEDVKQELLKLRYA